MRIAVIGAGAIGGALAKALASQRHDVVVGVGDTTSSHAQALQTEMGDDRVCPLRESVDGAEAVIFAIPGAAMPEVVGSLGVELDAKVVIDATNNLSSSVRNSLGAISHAAPNAVIFRAFNSLPSKTLADPTFDGQPADLFYAGRQGSEQQIVETIIRAAGLNPILVGGIEWAPVVDALGGLFFALGRSRPDSRLALKLLAHEPAAV